MPILFGRHEDTRHKHRAQVALVQGYLTGLTSPRRPDALSASNVVDVVEAALSAFLAERGLVSSFGITAEVTVLADGEIATDALERLP